MSEYETIRNALKRINQLGTAWTDAKTGKLCIETTQGIELDFSPEGILEDIYY